MNKRKGSPHSSVSEKAHVILNLILVVMGLMLFRSWHLATVQYEDRLEASRRPQRRTVIERPERGTIRDRFNIPLALNKIKFNAAVSYAQILEIPRIRVRKNEQGEKVVFYPRREHIKRLSELLARELEMSPEAVEDEIHARAALIPRVPHVIKEDIDERTFYRLKMLEREYLGIYAERVPKREYPLGKVACHITGYLGAISRDQWLRVVREIDSLESFIEAYENGEACELPKGYKSPQEVRHRLQDLEERAYRINDTVGKTGAESIYDEDLRGFRGKKLFESDARGNFLRELPGRQEPIPGKRVLLSISAELQAYAEQLLTESEQIRDGRSLAFDFIERRYNCLKQPWIKGGAIVALDPKTGDVLALASYPRFDPNDFISSGIPEENKKKRANIAKWLELDRHHQNLWDQHEPLSRELYSRANHEYRQEVRYLTWQNYLNLVLPKDNPSRTAITEIASVANALAIQKAFHCIIRKIETRSGRELINFLYEGEKHIPCGEEISEKRHEKLREAFAASLDDLIPHKQTLDAFLEDLPENYHKLLVIDLCRLAVSDRTFSDDLLPLLGDLSLEDYRDFCVATGKMRKFIRSESKKLFHDLQFHEWRKENGEAFIKEKRAEERERETYARPYLDYLKKEEKRQFEEFWRSKQGALVTFFLTGEQAFKSLHSPEMQPYVEHFSAWKNELEKGAHRAAFWWGAFEYAREQLEPLGPRLALKMIDSARNFQDLTRPLLGRYRLLRDSQGVQLEKHLATAYYPLYGFGYSRSHAYQQATIQGSIFKLVPGYAAALKRYFELPEDQRDSLKALNPLEMVDRFHRKAPGSKQWNVGYDDHGKVIPQFYKGGRLPRNTAHKGEIGKIDLTKALAMSVNPYFGICSTDILEHPDDLNEIAHLLSFGQKTGIDLPGEYAGHLPEDLAHNPTGLYSYTMGQHTLVVTPLQTAVMLNTIANCGKVLKPKILKLTAGTEPNRSDELSIVQKNFFLKPALSLVGIHFPLFTGAEATLGLGGVRIEEPEVVRTLLFPESIRRLLLAGMKAAVQEKFGSANPIKATSYYDRPQFIRDFKSLSRQIVGKTSTSEAVEYVDLDLTHGINMYKHIWFGGISFDQESDAYIKEEAYSFDDLGEPDLVVVVYLRFGDYGREVPPIAAQVIKRWKEIKSTH